MDLRQTLQDARNNPGAEYAVTGAAKVNGMKGPKLIRWDSDAEAFEGKRKNEWSHLDKHWHVITQAGVNFTKQSTPVAQALSCGAQATGVDPVLAALEAATAAYRAKIANR